MRYIHHHTDMERRAHITHYAPLASSEIATLWKTAQYRKAHSQYRIET